MLIGDVFEEDFFVDEILFFIFFVGGMSGIKVDNVGKINIVGWVVLFEMGFVIRYLNGV